MIPTRAKAELSRLAHAEQVAERLAADANPYLVMPMDRVIADARHGVHLAIVAWRERDPEGACRELGRVVAPTATADGGPDRAE